MMHKDFTFVMSESKDHRLTCVVHAELPAI